MGRIGYVGDKHIVEHGGFFFLEDETDSNCYNIIYVVADEYGEDKYKLYNLYVDITDDWIYKSSDIDKDQEIESLLVDILWYHNYVTKISYVISEYSAVR